MHPRIEGQHGECLYDAGFAGQITSYRSYRYPWVGKPFDPPTVVGRSESRNGIGVYVSWNGATEVTGWRVLAGPDPQNLRSVRDGARTGFETRIVITGRESYVGVQALDGDGAVLATSEAVQVSA